MATTYYHTANGQVLGETVGNATRTDYLIDPLGSVIRPIGLSSICLTRIPKQLSCCKLSWSDGDARVDSPKALDRVERALELNPSHAPTQEQVKSLRRLLSQG
jgi:hypothetical protein